MNLKYYLRGLGIGIIVTALMMGISSGNAGESLSDSEIKERARALGMTEESTVLADAVSSEAPQSSGEATAEPVQEPEAEPTVAPTQEPAEAPTQEPTPEPTQPPTADPTAEPTQEPTQTPTAEPTPESAGTMEEASEEVTIQIESGDGSDTVCRKLEEAGLVASASDFDRYLCENGYDKRIRVGAFRIPKGTEAQQIAEMITGVSQ